MNRYVKLSDSELDSLLLLSFYPNKKEKINIGRDFFYTSILSKIEDYQWQEDFSENLLVFLFNMDVSKIDLNKIVSSAIFSDLRILKMVALKTFHENRE